MGNMYTYFFYKKHPLIVIGPHCKFYLIIDSYAISLFLIIGFFNTLLLILVFPKINFYLALISEINYILQFVFHALTSIVDPGIPNRKYICPLEIVENGKINEDKKEEYKHHKICLTCNIIVENDKEISHCEECNICIENHDHHCVWSGKCIGYKNLFYFNVFLWTTLFFFIFSIIDVIYYFTQLTSSTTTEKTIKFA
jgi:hypothetical protein